MAGPLQGLRVVEFAGLGPAPFAALLLADLGADVVRVDRPAGTDPSTDALGRGKRSICLDLKDRADQATALQLADWAEVLIEGFRPGVMERLGLAPSVCFERNPALVYGRMTGWGQDGPLAERAGHDLAYIAVTGALWALGREEEVPAPPLNLVGDFGGGSLFLVMGVLAAVMSARQTGRGDVVDAAVVDGTVTLTTLFHGLRSRGLWQDRRGANLLDSGAPFYDVYRCADGRFLAVGALEPQFYAELIARTGFDGDPARQYDFPNWPEQRAEWAQLFASRTRDEWAELLADSDACAAPVLTWEEAPSHPQLAARGVFVDVAGEQQPAPAPRFAASPPEPPRRAPSAGEHSDQIRAMLELGR